MAAACNGAVLIVLSKPDIAYRGGVGSSLWDFGLTHCHRLRLADGGGWCVMGMLLSSRQRLRWGEERF